jgi:class 3 adenylate cyclase
MRCWKCGAENPDRANFCIECASAFARRCPSCNAANPPTAKFCLECAKSLEAVGIPAAGVASARQTLDGERRHLTLLFCDLVNSTEIAAHLDPEDWRDIAARYQSAATAAVTRFGGNVAKYLGDGLMVHFGWPEAHEDDAERAVRAALGIVEEVAALNGRLAPQHPIKLSVRVGIHTGSVVMGHGGGTEADAFGDVPNVASSVQSAAQPDSVLITAAVHDLVSGLFVVEDRGEQRLKGIAYPVRLYRVIQQSVSRRKHRAAIRAQTPFVGREDEMHLLLNRWEQACEGRGQVVLVVGEPGIGKSRVVEEFRGRIRDNPHLWVEGAGDQFFQSTPFHAVTQILDEGLGWHGDESPKERVALLERGLELAQIKLNEALPLIAELLNLPIPEKYPLLTFTPDQKRKRLLANLTAWLLNAARVQPVVIAMEDLHWIDPSTLELTQMLVEQVATAPLMLLYTARPEFRRPWPMRAHHAQITLSRLEDRYTREMVAGVVARAALTQDLIETVVKRTDGVPLFAEELTRLLLEGDAHSVSRVIPATLRDLLTARLDRLGPAKEVAQIAAVIGHEFSFELLQAAASMGETELQSSLEKLVDAELIYARGIAPEATYQFKHALIQDAAYEELLKTKRRELHLRVAQTISESFPADAEEHPEVIARHWTEAGEKELALAAWKKAAEIAFERHAFKEAEEEYRQALTIIRTLPETSEREAQELELMIRFVQVLQATKGWAAPEAADAAARAQTLAEKTNNLAQLVLQTTGLFATLVASADYPTASAVADRVLDLAKREGSPAILGVAHSCQITVCYLRADLNGAENYFAAGSTMLEPAGKIFSSALGAGFGYGSHTAWMRGFPDTARDRMRRAIAGATNLQSPFELAYVQWLAAGLQLFLRNFELAKTAAAASVALSDERGFQLFAAGARLFLGLAEAADGHQLDAAMPKIYSGFRGLEESMLGSTTSFLGCLAAVEALAGKAAQALETVERALQANPIDYARPEAMRIRGELRLSQQ